MDITERSTVSVRELAVVLGITSRRVQQLAQDGAFPQAERGKYLLCECVQAFVERKGTPDELEQEKVKADVALKQSKATIARLEAAELEGKMHRSEDVAAMTEDLIFTIRSSLMALPGRLAVDVAAAQSPAEASEIIRKEVALVMAELANYRYDPKKYEERVKSRRDWDDAE